jgi:hypothetical protein
MEVLAFVGYREGVIVSGCGVDGLLSQAGCI